MLWYIGTDTCGLNGLAVGVEFFSPTLEGSASTVDSSEVTYVTVDDKRLPGCHIVQQPAPAHHVMQLMVRQTFVEHREIVAEVKEGLHWIRLGQRAPTDMIDIALGQAIQLTTTQA